MKLLIVEDNQQMRRIFKLVVVDLAETVAECGDGSEAVAAYAAERERKLVRDETFAHRSGES
jgi:CheY-like chemotaxis protein